ncbi:MAG TPA: sigma-70 family RNA polymerase sigma factor [Streptosporangiaceae bacterium]|nr:sigma-70 family RNA polymerase sigma factor [Streptosporangiaceae bacterium]
MVPRNARALVRRYRPGLQESWPTGNTADGQKRAVGRHRNKRAVQNAGRSGAAWNGNARRDAAAGQADQALRALYEAHYRALTQLAALLAGDLVAAEDIVQDAFVAMHRTWRLLRTGDQALLYLRREVIRRARSSRPARRDTAAPASQSLLPGSPDTARALAVLATLPVRQREAVILRYWAGLSGTQIAAMTGARPQAVESSLAKGLACLAAAAEPDHGAAAWPYPAGPGCSDP